MSLSLTIIFNGARGLRSLSGVFMIAVVVAMPESSSLVCGVVGIAFAGSSLVVVVGVRVLLTAVVIGCP